MNKIYTFTNDFHHTTARVRLNPDVAFGLTLSPHQVRRLRAKLCGNKGCTCGGGLGQRGDNPEVETYFNSYGELVYRVIDPAYPEE